eukprot:gene11719-34448_t
MPGPATIAEGRESTGNTPSSWSFGRGAYHSPPSGADAGASAGASTGASADTQEPGQKGPGPGPGQKHGPGSIAEGRESTGNALSSWSFGRGAYHSPPHGPDQADTQGIGQGSGEDPARAMHEAGNHTPAVHTPNGCESTGASDSYASESFDNKENAGAGPTTDGSFVGWGKQAEPSVTGKAAGSSQITSASFSEGSFDNKENNVTISHAGVSMGWGKQPEPSASFSEGSFDNKENNVTVSHAGVFMGWDKQPEPSASFSEGSFDNKENTGVGTAAGVSSVWGKAVETSGASSASFSGSSFDNKGNTVTRSSAGVSFVGRGKQPKLSVGGKAAGSSQVTSASFSRGSFDNKENSVTSSGAGVSFMGWGKQPEPSASFSEGSFDNKENTGVGTGAGVSFMGWGKQPEPSASFSEGSFDNKENTGVGTGVAVSFMGWGKQPAPSVTGKATVSSHVTSASFSEGSFDDKENADPPMHARDSLATDRLGVSGAADSKLMGGKGRMVVFRGGSEVAEERNDTTFTSLHLGTSPSEAPLADKEHIDLAPQAPALSGAAGVSSCEMASSTRASGKEDSAGSVSGENIDLGVGGKGSIAVNRGDSKGAAEDSAGSVSVSVSAWKAHFEGMGTEENKQASQHSVASETRKLPLTVVARYGENEHATQPSVASEARKLSSKVVARCGENTHATLASVESEARKLSSTVVARYGENEHATQPSVASEARKLPSTVVARYGESKQASQPSVASEARKLSSKVVARYGENTHATLASVESEARKLSSTVVARYGENTHATQPSVGSEARKLPSAIVARYGGGLSDSMSIGKGNINQQAKQQLTQPHETHVKTPLGVLNATQAIVNEVRVSHSAIAHVPAVGDVIKVSPGTLKAVGMDKDTKTAHNRPSLMTAQVPSTLSVLTTVDSDTDTKTAHNRPSLMTAQVPSTLSVLTTVDSDTDTKTAHNRPSLMTAQVPSTLSVLTTVDSDTYTKTAHNRPSLMAAQVPSTLRVLTTVDSDTDTKIVPNVPPPIAAQAPLAAVGTDTGTKAVHNMPPSMAAQAPSLQRVLATAECWAGSHSQAAAGAGMTTPNSIFFQPKNAKTVANPTTAVAKASSTAGAKSMPDHNNKEDKPTLQAEEGVGMTTPNSNAFQPKNPKTVVNPATVVVQQAAEGPTIEGASPVASVCGSCATPLTTPLQLASMQVPPATPPTQQQLDSPFTANSPVPLIALVPASVGAAEGPTIEGASPVASVCGSCPTPLTTPLQLASMLVPPATPPTQQQLNSPSTINSMGPGSALYSSSGCCTTPALSLLAQSQHEDLEPIDNPQLATPPTQQQLNSPSTINSMGPGSEMYSSSGSCTTPALSLLAQSQHEGLEPIENPQPATPPTQQQLNSPSTANSMGPGSEMYSSSGSCITPALSRLAQAQHESLLPIANPQPATPPTQQQLDAPSTTNSMGPGSALYSSSGSCITPALSLLAQAQHESLLPIDNPQPAPASASPSAFNSSNGNSAIRGGDSSAPASASAFNSPSCNSATRGGNSFAPAPASTFISPGGIPTTRGGDRSSPLMQDNKGSPSCILGGLPDISHSLLSTSDADEEVDSAIRSEALSLEASLRGTAPSPSSTSSAATLSDGDTSLMDNTAVGWGKQAEPSIVGKAAGSSQVTSASFSKGSVDNKENNVTSSPAGVSFVGRGKQAEPSDTGKAAGSSQVASASFSEGLFDNKENTGVSTGAAVSFMGWGKQPEPGPSVHGKADGSQGAPSVTSNGVGVSFQGWGKQPEPGPSVQGKATGCQGEVVQQLALADAFLATPVSQYDSPSFMLGGMPQFGAPDEATPAATPISQYESPSFMLGGMPQFGAPDEATPAVTPMSQYDSPSFMLGGMPGWGRSVLATPEDGEEVEQKLQATQPATTPMSQYDSPSFMLGGMPGWGRSGLATPEDGEEVEQKLQATQPATTPMSQYDSPSFILGGMPGWGRSGLATPEDGEEVEQKLKNTQPATTPMSQYDSPSFMLGGMPGWGRSGLATPEDGEEVEQKLKNTQPATTPMSQYDSPSFMLGGMPQFGAPDEATPGGGEEVEQKLTSHVSNAGTLSDDEASSMDSAIRSEALSFEAALRGTAPSPSSSPSAGTLSDGDTGSMDSAIRSEALSLEAALRVTASSPLSTSSGVGLRHSQGQSQGDKPTLQAAAAVGMTTPNSIFFQPKNTKTVANPATAVVRRLTAAAKSMPDKESKQDKSAHPRNSQPLPAQPPISISSSQGQSQGEASQPRNSHPQPRHSLPPTQSSSSNSLGQDQSQGEASQPRHSQTTPTQGTTSSAPSLETMFTPEQRLPLPSAEQGAFPSAGLSEPEGRMGRDTQGTTSSGPSLDAMFTPEQRLPLSSAEQSPLPSAGNSEMVGNLGSNTQGTSSSGPSLDAMFTPEQGLPLSSAEQGPLPSAGNSEMVGSLGSNTQGTTSSGPSLDAMFTPEQRLHILETFSSAGGGPSGSASWRLVWDTAEGSVGSTGVSGHSTSMALSHTSRQLAPPLGAPSLHTTRVQAITADAATSPTQSPSAQRIVSANVNMHSSAGTSAQSQLNRDHQIADARPLSGGSSANHATLNVPLAPVPSHLARRGSDEIELNVEATQPATVPSSQSDSPFFMRGGMPQFSAPDEATPAATPMSQYASPSFMPGGLPHPAHSEEGDDLLLPEGVELDQLLSLGEHMAALTHRVPDGEQSQGEASQPRNSLPTSPELRRLGSASEADRESSVGELFLAGQHKLTENTVRPWARAAAAAGVAQTDGGGGTPHTPVLPAGAAAAAGAARAGEGRGTPHTPVLPGQFLQALPRTRSGELSPQEMSPGRLYGEDSDTSARRASIPGTCGSADTGATWSINWGTYSARGEFGSDIEDGSGCDSDASVTFHGPLLRRPPNEVDPPSSGSHSMGRRMKTPVGSDCDSDASGSFHRPLLRRPPNEVDPTSPGSHSIGRRMLVRWGGGSGANPSSVGRTESNHSTKPPVGLDSRSRGSSFTQSPVSHCVTPVTKGSARSSRLRHPHQDWDTTPTPGRGPGSGHSHSSGRSSYNSLFRSRMSSQHYQTPMAMLEGFTPPTADLSYDQHRRQQFHFHTPYSQGSRGTMTGPPKTGGSLARGFGSEQKGAAMRASTLPHGMLLNYGSQIDFPPGLMAELTETLRARNGLLDGLPEAHPAGGASHAESRQEAIQRMLGGGQVAASADLTWLLNGGLRLMQQLRTMGRVPAAAAGPACLPVHTQLQHSPPPKSPLTDPHPAGSEAAAADSTETGTGPDDLNIKNQKPADAVRHMGPSVACPPLAPPPPRPPPPPPPTLL